jgi:hypothetical protein
MGGVIIAHGGHAACHSAKASRPISARLIIAEKGTLISTIEV